MAAAPLIIAMGLFGAFAWRRFMRPPPPVIAQPAINTAVAATFAAPGRRVARVTIEDVPTADPDQFRRPASQLKPSPRAVDLVARFEGLRLNAYQDTGGVWTIGYGHTATARPGLQWSTEQARSALLRDLETHADDMRRLVKVDLSQSEFDALTSFVYNFGATQFSKSTLLRKLNAGDRNGAANEFMRWTYDNGRQLAGLQLRREAERELFLA